MVTSAENRNKAEPRYMNTLTVQPHPTELKPPCTSRNALPFLQVSRLSFTFNNVHEKFYLQLIVVTSSACSTIQVTITQQTGMDT